MSAASGPAWLMRQAGLAGISPRRSKSFTRRDPDADLAPDLVQRDFTAHAPNRLWVTDLTMIPTLEGPLWLSAIRDAFSRRVVGRPGDFIGDRPVNSVIQPAGRPTTHLSEQECCYEWLNPVNTRPSSSQHAWSEQVFKRPWARSATLSTMPWRRTCGCWSRPSASADGLSAPEPKRISRSSSTSTASTTPAASQKRLGYLSPIEFEEKHYADQTTAEPVNLKPRQPALTR